MAVSIVMPALEMAQENGKLLAWRKKEGESVSKGEPLLEIETDKAVVEVEAPGDGILAGIPAACTISDVLAPNSNRTSVARAEPALRVSARAPDRWEYGCSSRS